ncbi:MAG: PAS domain S-box protein, partial [Acidobacteria bacterium]|nr:PAS domain S-box protein [Acidobacteriota bacterium]
MGGVIVAVAAAFFIRRDYRQGVEFWQGRQTLAAESQARAVSSWLSERQADAEVLAALPSVKILMSGQAEAGLSPTSRRELEEVLTQVFDRFTSVYGYSGIYLIEADGAEILKSSGSAHLGAEACDDVLSSSERGSFRIQVRGNSPDDIILVLTAAVVDAEERKLAGKPQAHALGAVVLRVPLSNTLFTLLSLLPTPSHTGESVLVCRQGNEVVYISPARFAAGGRGFVRRKLETSGLAASATLLTGNISGEFSDYRGESVLATGRRIPLTGWGLVRKIDRSEALSGFYQTALLEVLVAVLAILVFALAWRGAKRRRHARSLEGKIQQQQAVLKLREYAQEVVDSVPSGLLVLSPDLQVQSCNRSFLNMFHLSVEEVEGRRLDEVIQAEHPPYRITDPDAIHRGEATTEAVLLDVAVAGRPEKRPARISIKTLAHQEDGGRLLLTVEDLTASERMRAAAEASERRMRDLVQSVDVIVWEAATGTPGFTFVSQRAEQILGFPVDQWLKEPDFFNQHVHPDDRGAVQALRQLVSAGQRFSEAEFRMVAADGRTVWVHEKVRVFEGAAGRPPQLRGVIVDITESKKAGEERARLSSAVEQTAESVMITDLAGRIVYVNPAFERVTGYRRAEVMGNNPRILKSGRHDSAFYHGLW